MRSNLVIRKNKIQNKKPLKQDKDRYFYNSKRDRMEETLYPITFLKYFSFFELKYTTY